VVQQKTDIIRQLEKDILPLQGFKPPAGNVTRIGLGAIEYAFPNTVFPTGALHEMLYTGNEAFSATGGFIAAVLNKLVKTNGTCLWLGSAVNIFPPALAAFGIAAERIIFVTPQKEKDLLWLMEEALKCEGLTAVVGEIKNIDFKASRRLQLAVEQSGVTGFVLRNSAGRVNTIACIARWKITPLASDGETPGVGFARWNAELLKVRNGKPGTWQIEWNAGRFQIIQPAKQPIWLNVSSQYGSAI